MPYRQNFPIPDEIDPPRKCLCIEIPWTDQHKQVVAGLLWELTQWFNWQRDGDESGRQLAAVYRDVLLGVDWSDMSCCCGEKPDQLRRVNPEDPSMTQISNDGGVTWTTDPLNPSIGGSTLPPPITAGVSANKCDAASNGRQHVQDFVAKVQEVITTGGVVWEALAAVCIFIVGLFLLNPADIPAIVPVLIGLFSIAFALTGTVWSDYFTSDVYDIITCALFCHMEDDGSFTDADANAVFSDLDTHLPAGVQKSFLLLVLKNQGTKGLNTLCAYGASADADCSSCECGDCPPAWIEFGTGSHDGCVYTIDSVASGGHQIAYLRFSNPASPNNDLCGAVSWGLVSGGSLDVTDFYHCHTGAEYFTGSQGDCVCFAGWVNNSGTPFQIQVTVGNC